MKLGTILRDGEAHLVAKITRGMVDVTRASRMPGWSTGELPVSLIALIRAWGQGRTEPMGAVRRLLQDAEEGRVEEILEPESPQIRWLAPVSPSKLLCIGLNYWDHCREQNVQPPSRPVLFGKWPNAHNAHRCPVAMAEGSDQIDFEAELAVVVGRRSRRLAEESALDAVFGYTAFNDVTARDFQKDDGQWIRGKSQDTFAPMGPWVVTADEIPDPQSLRIICRVNGTTYQDSTTAEMIFPVRTLLEFVSAGITLEPGDVLATGTPRGVGFTRKPPVFLKPGDVVEVEIERIGRLVNHVVPAAEAGAPAVLTGW